jgi:hypothetical protein
MRMCNDLILLYARNIIALKHLSSLNTRVSLYAPKTILSSAKDLWTLRWMDLLLNALGLGQVVEHPFFLFYSEA